MKRRLAAPNKWPASPRKELMKIFTSTLLAILVAISAVAPALGQIVEKKSLNLDGANQDEELALAGAAAFSVAGRGESGQPGSTPPATGATFIDSKNVSAAFAKGMPLLETAGYKVHASRRVEPGQAEIHTLDTDVIYVVEGSATLVTGGKAIDAREIAPNEIRGSKIEGGEEHQISKGQVIIIPNGLPHQFTTV